MTSRGTKTVSLAATGGRRGPRAPVGGGASGARAPWTRRAVASSAVRVASVIEAIERLARAPACASLSFFLAAARGAELALAASRISRSALRQAALPPGPLRAVTDATAPERRRPAGGPRGCDSRLPARGPGYGAREEVVSHHGRPGPPRMTSTT